MGNLQTGVAAWWCRTLLAAVLVLCGAVLTAPAASRRTDAASAVVTVRLLRVVMMVETIAEQCKRVMVARASLWCFRSLFDTVAVFMERITFKRCGNDLLADGQPKFLATVSTVRQRLLLGHGCGGRIFHEIFRIFIGPPPSPIATLHESTTATTDIPFNCTFTAAAQQTNKHNNHKNKTTSIMARRRPRYGQVVCGPPGSGKTTFCNGMQQYLTLLGRDACVINLDPANNNNDGDLPYEPIFDVCVEAVNLQAVMQQLELGPNGGLVYCMEYLESHADQILEAIASKLSETSYLILDLPGQVELYTHSTCVQNLLQGMVKAWDLRLTAVQLMDAHYCTDATKFLSATLLATTTMLRLELPAVNVLSKVDLLVVNHQYGPSSLPLELDFFTECHNLDRLLPFLHQASADRAAATLDDADNIDNDDAWDYVDDPEYQRARRQRESSPLYQKHAKLHRAMAELVDDFGLLSFVPLDVSNAESMGRVLAKIDQSNGYVFVLAAQASHSVNQDLFQCAIQSEQNNQYEAIADVKERLF